MLSPLCETIYYSMTITWDGIYIRRTASWFAASVNLARHTDWKQWLLLIFSNFPSKRGSSTPFSHLKINIFFSKTNGYFYEFIQAPFVSLLEYWLEKFDFITLHYPVPKFEKVLRVFPQNNELDTNMKSLTITSLSENVWCSKTNLDMLI